ncbi:MAG: hypothetical protein O8C66_07445 [Candidatus Methanoperedens sp.]|nr:hypothetical protein [Candidatus Methanoperedens sp.]MCZ7370328.1 hypothetical protein [Candidatus Methanoperedens sp.]
MKRFVEKAIKSDEFFLFALENPLGAMKECGAKLDVSSFGPKDFAAFFGALSGVKEMVKKKNIKDLTFEGIFGEAAVIRGTHLMAETTKGFYKDWEIGAYVQKGTLSTFDTNFDASGVTDQESYKEARIRIEFGVSGIITYKEASSETRTSQSKEWNNNDAITEKRSNTGMNKNFEKAGLREILGGPLIHPEDLAALAARIETFTEIAEEVEY